MRTTMAIALTGLWISRAALAACAAVVVLSLATAPSGGSAGTVAPPTTDQPVRDYRLAALAPDAASIACIRGDVLTVRDVASQHAVEWQPPCNDIPCGLAFAPDGKKLVVWFHRGTLAVWNIVAEEFPAWAVQSRAWVTVAAFSCDGSALFCGDDDGGVSVRDARTGQFIRRILLAAGLNVRCVSPSPRGNVVAAGLSDGSIHVFDESGSRVRVLPGHRGCVAALEFTPEGDRLISGGLDCAARIWSTDDGRLIREIAAEGIVSAVAASARGDRLALGDPSGRVHVFELPSGRSVGRFAGHSGLVRQLQFTAAGDAVYSTGRDGSVLLWDLATHTGIVFAEE